MLRARQHPARAVECPHCRAGERQPCTTPSKRHRKQDPCPARITAWAVQVAVCPACQTVPGVLCHIDGRPLASVHPQRLAEAQETAS